ncbi:MAG: DMT family protein [Thermoflavifilum sp.]|nr:DMT family protein [Thermoflavifilum sp.]
MRTVLLLICSNTFMTIAWYWHIGSHKLEQIPIWKVILISWSIAFFEYCFQVPANRIGALEGWTGYQLKIIQEVITLSVFIVFAWVYLKESLKWNYLLAFLLMAGAVYLVFKR